MIFKKTILGVAMIAIATAAGAGTTIRTENRFGGDASSDAIHIAGGKMRIQTSGDASGFMIFDSAARTVTIVQPQEQSYMVMDEETIRSMGNAVQQAMKQLESQLANLPPAQREQMRKMMEQQMGGMMGGNKPASRPEIVNTGETRTVAGYDCGVVRIMVDGASKGSACMADLAALGIPEEDRQTIRAMTDFSLALTEQFGDMMPAHMQAMAAQGYPVQYDSTVGGTAISGSLEGVETGSLDPGLFQVPAGYTQRSMPKMPGM